MQRILMGCALCALGFSPVYAQMDENSVQSAPVIEVQQNTELQQDVGLWELPKTTIGEAIQSQGGGAIPALPLEIKTSKSGIKYVSGGIGDEEMAQLKSIGQEYNLHLLVSAKTGEYITGADVRIAGADGKEILSVQGAGPYVFAKLPAGSYKIEAKWNGVTQKANVKLPDKGSVRSHIAF